MPIIYTTPLRFKLEKIEIAVVSFDRKIDRLGKKRNEKVVSASQFSKKIPYFTENS